jgi:mRNA interferase MazF
MPDPGDVVWVDFPGATGVKRRPAVIISTAQYHSARPDIIVGLITSKTAKANAATDYLIANWILAGLQVPSAFRCFFATISRKTILSTAGRLSSTDWQAVQARVRLAIDV